MTTTDTIKALRDALEQIKAGLSEKGPRVIAAEVLALTADASEDAPRQITYCEEEWITKTDWVQTDFQKDLFPLAYLGQHRADIMRDEIARLRRVIAHSAPVAATPAPEMSAEMKYSILHADYTWLNKEAKNAGFDSVIAAILAHGDRYAPADMRMRFESWAQTGDRAGPGMHRDDHGDYRDALVLAWWQAWCAATAWAAAPAAPIAEVTAVAWASEDNVAGGVRTFTKFSTDESEIDRWVGRHQAAYSGAHRVKVPLYRQPAAEHAKPEPVEQAKLAEGEFELFTRHIGGLTVGDSDVAFAREIWAAAWQARGQQAGAVDGRGDADNS